MQYSQYILNNLKKIQGDYSFVFYDNKNKKILIAKDPFGKKSLLLGFSKDGFVLSSCAIKPHLSKLEEFNGKINNKIFNMEEHEDK